MVTVRFAPSPTGFLHIGSARTALFNWLFARSQGGKYLIRIEDTDLSRSKKEFLDEILEDLKWLGLDWDGDLVHQSQRFDVYRKAAAELVAAGKGYREGEAYIFKVESGRMIELDDMIHGKIVINTDEIKDQVMIKSDGSPAYNFSCVVDDIHMGITHIVRGDDHVSNTPKQMLFYEALGHVPPKFGHMPLIMGTDGAKLSKRHGGVSVEEYKRSGFLPEAIANYLLLLGWSPGGDREMITLEEAVKIFKIDDMKGVQCKFDLAKLTWINGEYIARKKDEELLPLVKKQMTEAGIDPAAAGDAKILTIIGLYKVRMKMLSDFTALADCFFRDDFAVEEKDSVKYLGPEKNRANVKEFAERLERAGDFSHMKIEEVCRGLAEERGLKAGEIIHPTRMAISGKTKGAGLFEMMEVMGKDKVIERMRRAAA